MVDDADAPDVLAPPPVSSIPNSRRIQFESEAITYVVAQAARMWKLERNPSTQLLARLTPAQQETWGHHGYLDTVGSRGLDVYRILYPTISGNIIRHGRGYGDHLRFCITSAEFNAYEPELLALCQFMQLRLDEDRFLQIANALGPLHRMPPPW